jgi:hypothetical protein
MRFPNIEYLAGPERWRPGQITLSLLEDVPGACQERWRLRLIKKGGDTFILGLVTGFFIKNNWTSEGSKK